MAAKPTLYEMDIAPGSRSIKMVARLINLEIELKHVDLMKGEHLQEWFIKMNPQHTVPTLDDNGKYIWESSVICTYLIDKYAKDDKLYPKDLYKRAQCNQRLHFSNAILYQRTRRAAMSVYLGGTEIPENDLKPLEEAYEQMEVLLAKDDYLVGNELTVADLCAISLIGSIHEIFLPLDGAKYPKLHAWIERMKRLPFYEELEGNYAKKHKKFYDEIILKNKNAKTA